MQEVGSRQRCESHHGAHVKYQRRRVVMQPASVATGTGVDVDSELDYRVGEGHGHGRDERDMRVKEWAVESL